MSFGHSSCHCHACGKRWVGGCVMKTVCADCEGKGHGEIFSCAVCDKQQDDVYLTHLTKLENELAQTKLQNVELRKALELADSGHTEACISINKHPYPDTKDCKCWQKIKHDALGTESVGYVTQRKADCAHEPIPSHVGHQIARCKKCCDYFTVTERPKQEGGA